MPGNAKDYGNQLDYLPAPEFRDDNELWDHELSTIDDDEDEDED